MRCFRCLAYLCSMCGVFAVLLCYVAVVVCSLSCFYNVVVVVIFLVITVASCWVVIALSSDISSR